MKHIVIMVVMGTLLTVAGCNTMEGLGQDLQNGGKKIERSADESK